MQSHNNKPNRDRLFEQVVSVEAWRSAFDASSRCASIHVDVSFLEAKLGQEPESKVRFSVFLKRAEVLIYIPETDPVKVVQRSVARERPLTGQLSRQGSGERGYEVKGLAELSTSKLALMKANFAASGSSKSGQSQSISLQGEAKEFHSRQYTSEGSYCWEVTPAAANRLLGKIWDAINEPRLSIRHVGANNDPLDIACRVLVRCRREDIEIVDIDVKDGGASPLVHRFKANREAAAAAYIRAVLSKRDLQVQDFDEKYATVLLADVLIDEEIA